VRSPSINDRNCLGCSWLQCRGIDRFGRDRGAATKGLTATISAPNASLNAPDSGARAMRMVLGAKGAPALVPPCLASRRYQARIVSVLTSRNRLLPTIGRM
jgi:hypothetical protein